MINILGLNNRDLRAVFEKLRLKALDSGRLECYAAYYSAYHQKIVVRRQKVVRI